MMEKKIPPLGDNEIVEAALTGNKDAVLQICKIIKSKRIYGKILKRGASRSEADEILGDMLGDCFGGENGNLLSKYSGSVSLENYLQGISFQRLISLKRRGIKKTSIEDESKYIHLENDIEDRNNYNSEDLVIQLLRDSLKAACSKIDQERLMIIHMVYSLGIKRKEVAKIKGLREDQLSKIIASSLTEFRDRILAEIKERDPWLKLEWEDFVDLVSSANCLDSIIEERINIKEENNEGKTKEPISDKVSRDFEKIMGFWEKIENSGEKYTFQRAGKREEKPDFEKEIERPNIDPDEAISKLKGMIENLDKEQEPYRKETDAVVKMLQGNPDLTGDQRKKFVLTINELLDRLGMALFCPDSKEHVRLATHTVNGAVYFRYNQGGKKRNGGRPLRSLEVGKRPDFGKRKQGR